MDGIGGSENVASGPEFNLGTHPLATAKVEFYGNARVFRLKYFCHLSEGAPERGRSKHS